MLIAFLITLVAGTVLYFALEGKGKEIEEILDNQDLTIEDEVKVPELKQEEPKSESIPKPKKKKRYYGKPKPKKLV